MCFRSLEKLITRSWPCPSWRKLAEQVCLPLPVLTNILHHLLQFGLVASTRGARGGYCLARRPEDISLREMIEAVEGPTKLTMCCATEQEVVADDSQQCDIEDSCRIKGPVQRVHESLRSFLSDIDLNHIAFERVPVALGIDVGVKTSLAEYGEMIADEQSSIAAGDQ